MAATTLSGFLQCNFLSMDAPMQAHFEALCKTRLPKKRKRDLGSIVDTIPSAGKELAKSYLPTKDCVGFFQCHLNLNGIATLVCLQTWCAAMLVFLG